LLGGVQSIFLSTLKNVLAYRPTKWCVVIVLGLLPGLLFLSADDNEKELNEGLTAARVGDYNDALAKWFPIARQGGVEAQFRLGWLYETGNGAQQNAITAAHWYRQAAVQGHLEAQYQLGLFSFHGFGLPQDDAQAASYFFEAANKGHAKAQYGLGVLYQTGRGLPKDLHKSRYWFSRAIGNGFLGPNKSARV
jgi:TPR repeat protein